MARGFEEDGVQVSRPIKPFRENRDEVKPVRETRDNSRPGKDREIRIKLNPGRIGRVGLVVVVLLAVFFLGRLSANNFELTGLTTTEAVVEPSQPKEVLPEETVTEPKTKLKEESEPAVEDKSNEPVVETYKNTKISLNDLEVQWQDTWGKIIALDYSIINGEPGSITPGYFLIMVEGYEDVEKKATLSSELQMIRSGETQSGKVTLDKPFGYNEKEAGNLESVTVRVILFNNDEEVPKAMASAQKDLNLKG
ncbi:hypothetical protein J4479_00855 [Candidatus Woesearchaeota archaeon]|nr:hypothetical protein [Candidatus Woesearchaeota archaeon]